jgi:hypothetical protein
MKDAEFFHRVNQDYHRFAGVNPEDIWYFVLKMGEYDPLYREDVQPTYQKYQLPSVYLFEESDNKEVDVGDTGLVEREYDATMNLNRKSWLEKVVNASEPGPHKPKLGDIVCFHPMTQPRWFTVLSVKEHGVVKSSVTFTEWNLQLKERGSFSAKEETG